ncbi:MAG: metallophosphoesterase family protein [Alphaproteobacteria bacterium]
MTPFALAHLTDPHLPLPWPPIRLLASKRALGTLSWLSRRRSVHRPEVLAALVADLKAQAPDHIAVTGDLCNISLPEEYHQAARWLERLGSPSEVTVVPGNHDHYVAVDPAEGLDLWRAFMAGDDGQVRFPTLRVRGRVALVGVSTAAPMAWNSAGGRVGPEQTEATERVLGRLGREGLCRVVLIHHPPLPYGPRRKSLIDMAPFAAAVARAGVELILHGHTHTAGFGRFATAAGHAPVIGVPSGSARPVRHAEAAAWNLYRIEAAEAGWRIRVTTRALDGGDGGLRMAETADYELSVASARA